MEHQNRVGKGAISSLGPTKLQCMGKCLGEIVQKYTSLAKKRSEDDDCNKCLLQFQEENIKNFEVSPARKLVLKVDS